MRCDQCGSENAQGAMFCAMCGSGIGIAAPRAAPAMTPHGAAPGGHATQPAHQYGSHYGPGYGAPLAQPAYGTPVAGSPFAREEFAGWWQRLGGYVLDGLIFFAILLIPGIVVLVAAISADPDLLVEGHEPNDPALAILGLALLTLVVVSILWQVLWIRSSRMGRPGQRICGYVVTDAHGHRVGTGRAIGRMFASVLYALSYLGYVFMAVSGFTIGLTDKRQALHDMMAGTLCLRRDALARRGMGPDAVAGAVLGHAGGMPAMHHPMGNPAGTHAPRPHDQGPFF